MKTIFEIPHEILVEIILYLTPRERLVLSDSCVKFNSLVFEDKESLRHLDFSKPGHSASDVDKYFQREITCNLIRGVNLNNVIIADRFSDACIAKAINLVDVNLHGIKMDIRRLEKLLNPLQHVKRLSFKWREGRRIFINHDVIFRQRLNGLIYLSVDAMFYHLNPLILLLQMCQGLKELHISAIRCMFDENPTLPDNFPLPKSIEIVDYSGFMVLKVKRRIRELLSNPEEWTDFRIEHSTAINRNFHMERNVQVCDELLDHGTIKGVRYDPEKNHCDVGRVLIPVDLLAEVVNMNYQNVPKEFCCLSRSGSSGLLTINDAKRLLKDSSYQITSLKLHHKVEINCDLHLIASAFLYLEELVLAGIVSKESTRVEENFEQRLRRKSEATTPLQERRNSSNLNSSFKMIVQNTPRLRHLTLKCRDSGTKRWDFEGLLLISGWKNLETLILSSVPLGDGSFLVEIGKQCQNLKHIDFSDRTYPPVSTSYEEQFLEMLKHCKNLRNVRIRDYSLSKPTQMFILIRNNPFIETIELSFIEHEDTPADLTFSIEQLLDRCSQLTRFCFEFKDVDNKLARGAFQRLNNEQNQRTLKISFRIDLSFLTRGQIVPPDRQVLE